MSAMLSSIKDEFRSIKSVSDLISWRQPKATGIVVGSLLAVILFYWAMGYTMVTFACRIFQIAAGLGCAAGMTGKITRDPQNMHEKVENFVDVLAPLFVKICEKLYNIVTFANMTVSAQVLAASFLVGFLGNWMSDIVFAVVAIVLVFATPIVYEKKKKEIDQVLDKVNAFVEKKMGMFKTGVEEVAKKAE